MKRLLATILALPALASAETITFEADTEIMVVRGYEAMPGFASFDIIGSKDGSILCVAMNAEGKPVATATGYAELGTIMFTQMSVDDIDQVACRYNG